MNSQLLVHETTEMVMRDRVVTGAVAGRSMQRPRVSGKGTMVAVLAVTGEALVRAGNVLRGDSASRPVPVDLPSPGMS